MELKHAFRTLFPVVLMLVLSPIYSGCVAMALVGAGSLSALFAATLVGIVVSTRTESPLSTIVAVIADACFFAYVVDHVLNRRTVERRLAEARDAAERNAPKVQFT